MNSTKVLASRLIKSNKIHSLIVGIAIILTAVMFTTIISITVSIYQGMEIMKQMATGSDFHAILNTSSSDYLYTDEEDAEVFSKIKNHPLVKEAYILNGIDRVAFEESDIGTSKTYPIYSSPDEKVLTHMFSEITDGRYPQNGSEILFNSYYNKNVKVGDTITVYSTSSALAAELTYTVTGLFTSQADMYGQIAGFTNDQDYQYNDWIYVIFKNPINIKGKAERICQDINEYIDSMVNNAYNLASLDFLTPANIFFILLTTGIVFLCGFLLIYNIYSISLTRDMKIYGMMKTLGTTKKQLKSIVRKQINVIYIISFPVGMIAGYLIGWKALSPLFMSLSGKNMSYKFNWVILIFTLVFTYLTTAVSAIAPVGRIAKMSCITAMKESESSSIKIKKKKSKNGMVPWRMALSNMSREKKKNTLTILSVSLSVIVFVFISLLVNVFETSPLIELFDFKLSYSWSKKYTYNDDHTGQVYHGMPNEITEQIESIDGVTEVYPILKKSVLYSPSGELYDKMASEYEEALKQSDAYYYYDMMKALESNCIAVTIWGIPDDIFSKESMNQSNFPDGEFSEKLFKEGKHVIIVPYSNIFNEHDSYFNVGDTVSLDILNNDYTVMCLAKNSWSFMQEYASGYSSGQYSLTICMPYSAFLSEFDDGVIDTIDFNIDPEKYESVTAELSKYFGDEREYSLYSLRAQLEEYHDRAVTVGIVGYSLCVIILMIGIMNYINSVICGVYTRRHEFALLEAVGMTNSQLKKMQLFEGMYFILFTAVIGVGLGVPMITKMCESMLSTKMQMNFISPLIMLLGIAVCAFVTILVTLKILRRETTIERLRQSE